MCKARLKVNQTDAAGLYDIKWSKTGNTFNAGGSSMSGTLKALFDIRDGNNGENFTGLAKVLNSKGSDYQSFHHEYCGESACRRRHIDDQWKRLQLYKLYL